MTIANLTEKTARADFVSRVSAALLGLPGAKWVDVLERSLAMFDDVWDDDGAAPKPADADGKPWDPPAPTTSKPNDESTIAHLASLWRSDQLPEMEFKTPLHENLIRLFWPRRKQLTEFVRPQGVTPIWWPRACLRLLRDDSMFSEAPENVLDAGMWEVWRTQGAGKQAVLWFSDNNHGPTKRLLRLNGGAGFWRGMIGAMEDVGLLNDLAKWEGWDKLEPTKAKLALAAKFPAVEDVPDPRRITWGRDAGGDIRFAVDLAGDSRPEFSGTAHLSRILTPQQLMWLPLVADWAGFDLPAWEEPT